MILIDDEDDSFRKKESLIYICKCSLFGEKASSCLVRKFFGVKGLLIFDGFNRCPLQKTGVVFDVSESLSNVSCRSRGIVKRFGSAIFKTSSKL